MAIHVPSRGPDDWRRLLADPEKHWRTGYSARALAHSWEAASGVPPEIDTLLGGGTELLVALPEHRVPLPGGRRPSQCDMFALIRRRDETLAVAVEGKVNEPFGPTLDEWLSGAGPGKIERIGFIAGLLGLALPLPGALHYQLLHRTAAAIIEARRFGTSRAAMVVHSFSPDERWFDAYAAFTDLLGVAASVGRLAVRDLPSGMPLELGWAKGDSAFLAS